MDQVTRLTALRELAASTQWPTQRFEGKMEPPLLVTPLRPPGEVCNEG